MSAILAAFLNAGIAGAGVTVAVWLALWLSPRRAINAATRYAVWWITLLIVAALPLFFLPQQETPAPVVVSTAPAPIGNLTALKAEAPLVSSLPSTSTVEVTPAPVPVPARDPFFPISINAGAWPARIFGLWGIVTLFMLLRLCASYIVLERRKTRAQPMEKLRDWPVRALISPDIASPMAAGLFRPAILLPERLIEELDDDELEQIRVHETAHLLRRDDIALLVQRTIEAVFALHPLVRWITRRIDLEREIACDDFVVEHTGQARPYASCLTRLVEIAGGVRSSLVAAAATEERSHLARRIEMLLDKTRHKGTRLLKLPLLLIAGALLLLASIVVRAPGLIAFAADGPNWFDPQPPVPPAPPMAPVAPAAAIAQLAPDLPNAPELPEAPEVPVPAIAPEPPSPPDQSIFESNNNRTITSSWNDGLHRREMKFHGDAHFTDDESDVKSMSSGGYFSYEESYGFTSRRFEAAADSSGKISRRFLVDGREKPLDADAMAWLRAALPSLVRESGIDAPERVRRILKQGGVPAVLAEIGKINSDRTKSLYVRQLVGAATLNSEQFQSLLRLVRGINSDGDKAALLQFLAPSTLKDGLRDYTFEAVKTIHSDGDKSQVLKRFISVDPSRGTLTMVARSDADISSDGDKASVLVELSAHLRGNSDLGHPFFKTAESIHSDGDRAHVLMAAMAAAGEQRDTLLDAIRAARTISSDGDKSAVLVHATGYWKDDELLRNAYFETARSVHSDGDKAHALNSLIGRTGVSDRTLIDAVQCATTISSDGDKSAVLVEAANHSSGKGDVREAIRVAAGTVHSDGDYRRVMTAIDLRASANRP